MSIWSFSKFDLSVVVNLKQTSKTFDHLLFDVETVGVS